MVDCLAPELSSETLAERPCSGLENDFRFSPGEYQLPVTKNKLAPFFDFSLQLIVVMCLSTATVATRSASRVSPGETLLKQFLLLHVLLTHIISAVLHRYLMFPLFQVETPDLILFPFTL